MDRTDTWWDHLPLAQGRPVLAYGATVAMVTVAFAIRYALLAVLPSGMPFTLFFPVIIAAAVLFGLGPGILAGVLGLGLAWLFFVPAVGSALGAGAPVALVLYTGVIATSLFLVWQLQRANARARAARRTSRKLAETSETLFRELQHRVGNNLQMVSAVLSLQKRKLTDPAAIAALDEAAERVHLIGRIQRQLYEPDGAQQRLSDLLERVAADCLASSGRHDVVCRTTVQPGLELRSELAIPVSLVVFEAVSNAIEHGFPDRGGTILLSARSDGPWVELSVVDDGLGLPESFAMPDPKNLGLKLSYALARQCGGSFNLACGEGTTRAVLRLPGAAPG